MTGGALAQATSNSTSSSNSNSVSGASIVNHAPAVVTSRGRNDITASAFAPGLTAAGINSCAGSVSGGVGGTGFNFGIGGTYEMDECTARANAAALAGLGQGLAALESLCQSPRMRQALNASGTVCPSQRAEYLAAQQRANESGQLYYATELAQPEPVVVRRSGKVSRAAARRAAIDEQASNSGAGSVAQQASVRGR
jgi:hypothetical protein